MNIQKPISFLNKELNLSACTGSIELENREKHPLSIRVVVAGSPAIKIPKEFREITIPPGGIKRIPVSYEKKPIKKGWPIARRVKQRSLIQVWKVDKAENLLLDSIPVITYGPVVVDKLHCFYPIEEYKPMPLKGNSPPEITITAFEPGTTITKNTGTVELSWNVTGADELYDVWTFPDVEVLEPGTFTGGGSDTSSDHVTPAVYSFTYSAGASLNVALFAENGDGEASDHEMIYNTAEMGYHHAKCPAGGSIYTSELDDIRDMLVDIEACLRANRLADLPAFITRWNAAAPADYRVGELEDMDYLSGRVGTGNLSDDMLTAMENVLIYLKPHTLPRGFRAGTIPSGSDRRPLCDAGIYGLSTRNWVAICTAIGADALTLAHELFHYASTSHNGNEMRAILISWAIFDDMPW